MCKSGVAVRIVIAPAARTCSQKIANLQAGIKVVLLTALLSSLQASIGCNLVASQRAASRPCDIQEASAEHQWVLCVDDDVLLYETFLEDLITSMQQRPSFFMATG